MVWGGQWTNIKLGTKKWHWRLPLPWVQIQLCALLLTKNERGCLEMHPCSPAQFACGYRQSQYILEELPHFELLVFDSMKLWAFMMIDHHQLFVCHAASTVMIIRYRQLFAIHCLCRYQHTRNIVCSQQLPRAINHYEPEITVSVMYSTTIRQGQTLSSTISDYNQL